jgi:hypothetical protein
MVGALVIAAFAFYLRHDPQPSLGQAPASHSVRSEPSSIPAEQPQTRKPSAPADGTAPPDERAAEPVTPLPQANPPAPITEAMEDLKLPPIPEILDTEREFAAEAVDASWSPQAEAHILDEIAQATGLKLVTLGVECKTHLCRVHMAQQELSRTHPFPDLVGRAGMKPLWVVVGMDRNKVPTSIAYLERE